MYTNMYAFVKRLMALSLLVPRLDRGIPVGRFATIVIFEDLLVCHGRNAIIVKLEPSSLSIGLDKSKVVSAVQIARVDEDAVQAVEVRFGPVRGLVQELLEVDFEGELVSIVDLEMEIRSID
jgi:hypothetical protein